MEVHALGELMPGKGSMNANGLVPRIAPTSKTHRRGQTHRVPSAKGGQKRQAPRKILEAWGILVRLSRYFPVGHSRRSWAY